jgi:hypothetical protein
MWAVGLGTAVRGGGRQRRRLDAVTVHRLLFSCSSRAQRSVHSGYKIRVIIRLNEI